MERESREKRKGDDIEMTGEGEEVRMAHVAICQRVRERVLMKSSHLCASEGIRKRRKKEVKIKRRATRRMEREGCDL